jgi:SH3 domain protein
MGVADIKGHTSSVPGHPHQQRPRFPVRRLALLLICFTALVNAQADTRYVTDQCNVSIRKGEGPKHKTLRILRSGTELQVIGGDGSSGYTQVRTPDGTVGFVATTELQAEPAARNRLTAMEARLAELQQAPDALASKLGALQAEHQELKVTHERVARDRDRFEQELATLRSASVNIVEITDERAELRKRVAELTRKAANLEQENRELSLQTSQRWFLIGAGVVGAGVLTGFLLPNLRFRRRKSSWGSL